MVTKTITRPATAADVAKHEAWTEATTEARAKNDGKLLAKLGNEPPIAEVGQPIQVVLKSGGRGIFWGDGVKPIGDAQLVTVSETTEGNVKTLIQRLFVSNAAPSRRAVASTMGITRS